MSFDFEEKYKIVRKMVVRGELTAREAKLWLNDLSLAQQGYMEDRLKKFGTRVNRESKQLESMLAAEEEQ